MNIKFKSVGLDRRCNLSETETPPPIYLATADKP